MRLTRTTAALRLAGPVHPLEPIAHHPEAAYKADMVVASSALIPEAVSALVASTVRKLKSGADVLGSGDATGEDGAALSRKGMLERQRALALQRQKERMGGAAFTSRNDRPDPQFTPGVRTFSSPRQEAPDRYADNVAFSKYFELIVFVSNFVSARPPTGRSMFR